MKDTYSEKDTDIRSVSMWINMPNGHKRCRECDYEAEKDSNYCPNCGADMSIARPTSMWLDMPNGHKQCRNCDYEAEKYSNYCPNCGADMFIVDSYKEW